MRKNEKETNDPVGSEANPKASEMGQTIGGGGKASEGHGGSVGQTMTVVSNVIMWYLDVMRCKRVSGLVP